jgi:hypothetical protein
MKMWKRIGASFIDLWVGNAIMSIVLIPFKDYFVSAQGTLGGTIFTITLLLFSMVIILASFSTYSFAKFGGSPGKLLFNIKIRDNKNNKALAEIVFKREILKWTLLYASMMLYALFIFLQIISGKKAYHDSVYNLKIK